MRQIRTPQQVPLETLIAHSAQAGGLAVRWEVEPGFTPIRGFHVYGDLGLHLRLSAAEDDRNAQRYLEVLKDYASIADACAREVSAHLLEVQGERIHLLLPAESVGLDSVRRVFAFATSFTQTIYTKIKPKAGDEWGGFAMAADHGPAILLPSDCGGGSLVSLGNAANAPAKRLGRVPGVTSGHCAIRRELLKNLLGGLGTSEWIEVNVLEPTELIASYADPVLTDRMFEIAKRVLGARRAPVPVVFAAASSFADPANPTVENPMRIQGLCFRADLDGFTRDVEMAFAGGPSAIATLVGRFLAIMQYPRQFSLAMGRPVIELPWAGDCSNLIMLARTSETYQAAKRYLPVTAALAWHGQKDKNDRNRVPWSQSLGKAKWAVGIAGGDETEGSDGVVLVANLETSGRRFRVAAGWGMKRSHDAYQADSVRAGDTIVPNEDYADLDSPYQDSFKELDSRFMVASHEDLKVADAGRRAELSKASPVVVPNVITRVPAARPYFKDV